MENGNNIYKVILSFFLVVGLGITITGKAQVTQQVMQIDNIINPFNGEKYYVGDNKIVIIEIESAKVKSNWIESTTIEGFSGAGYYYFDGSLNRNPGVDSITYQYCFYLPENGTYKMAIRNYVPNDDYTQSNDSWVKMDDDRWWKHFSHTNWKWNWETGLDDGQENFYEPVWDLEAGFHYLKIGGRSENFCLDKIHIYDINIDEKFALDPDLIPSASSDGSQPVISLSRGFFSYDFVEGEISDLPAEEVSFDNVGENVLGAIKATAENDLLILAINGQGNDQTLKMNFNEEVKKLKKGNYSCSIKLSCDNASDRGIVVYLNIN